MTESPVLGRMARQSSGLATARSVATHEPLKELLLPTLSVRKAVSANRTIWLYAGLLQWAGQDSNLGPTDYECAFCRGFRVELA